MNRQVVVFVNDVKKHAPGCDCGFCNDRQTSYVACVYPVTEDLSEASLDSILDQARQQPPLLRFCASSPDQALEKGRGFCRDNNLYEFGSPLSLDDYRSLPADLYQGLRQSYYGVADHIRTLRDTIQLVAKSNPQFAREQALIEKLCQQFELLSLGKHL